MACNSCGKAYNFFRKEKGCPNCGFSLCSSCIEHNVFVQKLNKKVKVCAKCKLSQTSDKPKSIEPPDAYYKRIGLNQNQDATSVRPSSSQMDNNVDKSIMERLNNLKKDSIANQKLSEDKIASRLQKLKDVPTVTYDNLHERLAKLKGTTIIDSKATLPPPETRTEQQQTDDLMKQYLEQTEIDSKYHEGFESILNSIETRLHQLKKGEGTTASSSKEAKGDDSENEEESVRKIIEKLKAESMAEDEFAPNFSDELPFCEICNEDATVRCLGCRYIFCQRCFRDHKDDDDGCDKCEKYIPPNRP